MQVKSYAAGLKERLESGMEAVKEFLSTLSSDERWGVMLAVEEEQPQMFDRLVAAADWVHLTVMACKQLLRTHRRWL